ncbi:MAG TPA: class E sortase [Candidatus Limnocylindrales bacterium]|nr:class E sortase [Candidatus Limnocylindrales bacterium]
MSVSRSEIRKKRKFSGRSKFYSTLAFVMIVLGFGLLAHAGYERLVVRRNQAQLRDDFTPSAGFARLVTEDLGTVAITEWQPMRMIIPAIDVDLIAVGGGDVFDKALLNLGPTHFNDQYSAVMRELGIKSSLPNTESGNVSFAGHRAGRWNFFLDIDQLVEGDEIFLDVAGYRFIYHVEWVRIFSKYDWDPIRYTDYPAITLQTCDPKHVENPDYRLMARGKLYEVIRVPAE